MQGIYTYIPDTNYFPREYNVAAILLLLFMVFKSLVSVLNLLYFYISTFRSMCAVPNMDVFWSSLTSCFFWYVAYVFSKWLWNSPSRPYYYWYHLCFYNPHALYFYCKIFILRIFSPSFLITFLSPEIATSINIHVPFSLSRITMFIIIIIIVVIDVANDLGLIIYIFWCIKFHFSYIGIVCDKCYGYCHKVWWDSDSVYEYGWCSITTDRTKCSVRKLIFSCS